MFETTIYMLCFKWNLDFFGAITMRKQIQFPMCFVAAILFNFCVLPVIAMDDIAKDSKYIKFIMFVWRTVFLIMLQTWLIDITDSKYVSFRDCNIVSSCSFSYVYKICIILLWNGVVIYCIFVFLVFVVWFVCGQYFTFWY